MTYKIKGTTVINDAGGIDSAQEKIIANSSLTLEPPPIFQGTVSGYNSGGAGIFGALNIIDKFPFAADANATDVGDLAQGRRRSSGQSSAESGYTSGGLAGPANVNTIDKFSFSADGNATDVGDLTLSREGSAGQSSTVSGYASGNSNVIDKFPFSSDSNATDVGDLTQSRQRPAGQQV